MDASMGPRSHERGNEQSLIQRNDLHGASMGPRSHERGNFLAVWRRRSMSRSFNGATLSRAWKQGDSLLTAHTDLASGNGLQWGHALTSVETNLPPRLVAASQSASLG